MKKEEFLEALRQCLSGLPREDVERSLDFYGEAIADRMESGVGEEEAVLALGSPEEIAKEILAETSLPKLIYQRVKPNRSLRIWEVVLLVLGAPLWLSLLLAAVSVCFAVYLTIWSLLVALYAVVLSCALGGGFFLVRCVSDWVLMGPGLLLIGLSILLFFAANGASKGILALSKTYLLYMKKLFMKKEERV